MKFAGDEDMMKVFDKALSMIKGVRQTIDVDIRDNFLNDKRLQGIVTLIANNPQVTRLCLILPGNFITDRGFKDLMTVIASCKELRSLIINLDW